MPYDSTSQTSELHSGASGTSAGSRIARIKRGIKAASVLQQTATRQAALADLRAWQEIAERHRSLTTQAFCHACSNAWPCLDLRAADAALDRLDTLWGES